MSDKHGKVVPSPEIVARVRAAIDRDGTDRVATRLEINGATLARYLAGFKVNRGTEASIKIKLLEAP